MTQLKRILKAKKTWTKKQPERFIRQAVQAVGEELRGSGSNIGYRQMTPRLVSDHRLGKETVRALRRLERVFLVAIVFVKL